MEKTGAFILDSQPQNADIYINGKLQQTLFKQYFSQTESHIKTPAKIKNLLPGEYDIKIELEGYLPWMKKLAILPNTSTYAENIFLFKKSLPVMATQGKIFDYQLSPDKNIIASLADNKAFLYYLDDGLTKEFSAPAKAGGLLWSPDNKKILVNNIIINTDTGETTGINDNEKGAISNCKWNADNADEIFCQSGDAIKKFNLVAKTSEEILSGRQTGDYLIENDYAYVIDKANSKINITKIADKKIAANINLPGSDNYIFINQASKLINLYDKDHYILYLIDPSSLSYNPLKETINNVKNVYWTDDNKLLYFNDYEIWTLNLENGGRTLLTRISEKINSAIMLPNNNYVLYNTNSAIYAIELDDREKRNITEIIRINNISKILMNDKGDTLYFYAQAEKQEGLFNLKIN